MKQSRKKSPWLSPHRAFVVQFGQETEVEQGHFVGRVEHVVSGKSQRFQSLEELLEFIGRVLSEQPEESSKEQIDS